MSISKMQDEFEAWHRTVITGVPPHEKYSDGDYMNQHVQRYWLGWQASRAALVIELPEACATDIDGYWMLPRKDVRAAIQAAGVRVKP